jgi:hypothetical protein
MAVTGYYYVSSTVTVAFCATRAERSPPLDVRDGLWTEPESINDAGDITGFYEVVAGVPQGFLRYADGRIVTFDPPASRRCFRRLSPSASTHFDEIAGNYPDFLILPSIRFHTVARGSFHHLLALLMGAPIPDRGYRAQRQWNRGGLFCSQIQHQQLYIGTRTELRPSLFFR